MSFVSRLRMANMFPIQSDLGNARINVPDDNYDEIINQALASVPFNRGEVLRPNGLNTVAAMNNRPAEGLRFGGVVGPDSNPGADILNRAKMNAERIYGSYGQPLNEQVKGPSNDEINLERYFERKNKEKVADAALANSGTKGWKTVTITDPNDPTKQINARINEITGETQPIELNGGVITRTGSARDIQTQIDNEAKGAANRKATIDKANKSLSVLSDLMDDKGNLTKEGARAVGKSSIGNWIPTTLGYSGSLKIGKLQKEQVLELIKELKEQSRTGATGMGNMSNKDLSVIEKAASLLDTGLDEDEFKKQLGVVRTELQDIVTRMQSTPDRNIRPAVSHERSDGKVRVKNKETGETGWVSKQFANSSKYELVK